MTDRAALIAEALQTWAPTYPRRVGRKQRWTQNFSETTRLLLDEEGTGSGRPFVSTYSFPRGHTKENAVPRIDTLFIDFDFDDGDYVRGSGDVDAWRRDMSHLLVRARKVASVIASGDRTASWRASLSGHKGIHLFLDFEPLDTELGDFRQYVAGLSEYADELVTQLSEATGIRDLDNYVDVTSGDLGRLCRAPNTRHSAATESFGEDRYCVPVSITELMTMTPEDYEHFTQSPREPSAERRSPSSDAAEIIEHHIRDATPTKSYGSGGHISSVDWNRVKAYREQSNDELTLDDVRFLTSNYPCVWEFHEREDKFEYGNQSHEMETHCIAVLLENNISIDVIKEFLSTSPDYDEQYTEERIRELIARDFSPYSTPKLLRRAPEFCGYDWCKRCQNVLQDDAELRQLHT
jgi:hypothetical protein